MAEVPFKPGAFRYDQSTFWGRFKRMADLTDPRCLLPKTFFGMSLDEAVNLLEEHKAGKVPAEASENKLWLAQKIATSSIHPDTNLVIPPYLRMSGFAVFNTPILVGLLMPNQGLLSMVFFHSLNQTHNAFVNYANRNASQPTPMSKVAQGYAGALLSSVSIAVGLNESVKRLKMPAARKAMLSRFVAFPAVAIAAVFNITLMRRSELTNGIELKDHLGYSHGVSQVAAKQALTQTALTRVVLPMPLLILPPLVMMGLEKTPLLRGKPRLNLPVQALVCTMAFVVGLPFAIALFPQTGTIAPSAAEPQFHNVNDANGKKITQLFYNKGL